MESGDETRLNRMGKGSYIGERNMRGENKECGQRTCELVLEGSGWFPGDTLEVMYPCHCRNMAESIPIWWEVGRKGENKREGKGVTNVH